MDGRRMDEVRRGGRRLVFAAVVYLTDRSCQAHRRPLTCWREHV